MVKWTEVPAPERLRIRLAIQDRLDICPEEPDQVIARALGIDTRVVTHVRRYGVVCSATSCLDAAGSSGLCPRHYQQRRRENKPDLQDHEKEIRRLNRLANQERELEYERSRPSRKEREMEYEARRAETAAVNYLNMDAQQKRAVVAEMLSPFGAMAASLAVEAPRPILEPVDLRTGGFTDDEFRFEERGDALVLTLGGVRVVISRDPEPAPPWGDFEEPQGDEAADRLHLVDGLLIALLNIDEVIQVIRTSDDTAAARARLMGVFDLSELQANHVLDTPLCTLTRYDGLVLEREGEELRAQLSGGGAVGVFETVPTAPRPKPSDLAGLLRPPRSIEPIIEEEIDAQPIKTSTTSASRPVAGFFSSEEF